MPEDSVISRGGCLCGGVRYSVRGPLRYVVACHCSQCRKTSGHFVAATGAEASRVTFDEASTLAWYASSESAERGFCARCGGNLFWRPRNDPGNWLSIMAGTLDRPTRLKLKQHIFVADKSDYYEITDGAPQDAGAARLHELRDNQPA
jgi:hypothetical protein